MTPTDPASVAALAAEVIAVSGVSRLYPAGTLASRVGSALSAVTGASTPGDRIAVGDDRVAIRIGVDSGFATAVVCRDVYAVSRAWADRAGLPDAAIEVTAASIDDATQAD
ncbi:MAG: hypothetical protein J0I18_07515 [Actinobacteria bacterium]|nr:hypothetical protein [Actinomycetota bacterium]